MLEVLPAVNSAAGLAALALIAFCDTLIGVGFFIFGELAFLAAGAAFSASGTIWPAVVVLVFAWAGDMASYLIGARFGTRLSLRYLKQQKRRRAWRRAKSGLAARGASFVVLSRLMGPVAWITPFLAGAMGMPRRKFAPAAALGVVLGVGQFLIYGAVGRQVLGQALSFVAAHIWTIALLISVVLAGVYVWRRSEKSVWNRLLKVGVVAGVIFLSSNLVYFFVLNSHPVPPGSRTVLGTICEATDGPFQVHPGETSLHLPQPVNVMLVSESTGAELMTSLGWQRNVTFSHDDISFPTYLRLLFQKTPPVSELYLNGHPADNAFQMPGTIQNREHIRWWEMGSGVHFGALSRDDEIAIKYYGHLPVLLHDIDPMVDLSRDALAEQIAQSERFDVVGIAEIAQSVSDDDQPSDYETDGGVLVLADRHLDLPAEVMGCLRIRPDRDR